MQCGSGHEQATNYPLENHLEDWLWRVACQDAFWMKDGCMCQPIPQMKQPWHFRQRAVETRIVLVGAKFQLLGYGMRAGSHDVEVCESTPFRGAGATLVLPTSRLRVTSMPL